VFALRTAVAHEDIPRAYFAALFETPAWRGDAR
jgi:hypothetical protein